MQTTAGRQRSSYHQGYGRLCGKRGEDGSDQSGSFGGRHPGGNRRSAVYRRSGGGNPGISYYGTEPTSGKHFVIHTYENNVKIGDKTASVTVIGNEKKRIFRNTHREFQHCCKCGNSGGKRCREQLLVPRNTDPPAGYRVKIGNKTLSTSDYDVTYGENIKAGTDGGSIMVKGKNEYAGLIKLVTFDINPTSDGRPEGA